MIDDLQAMRLSGLGQAIPGAAAPRSPISRNTTNRQTPNGAAKSAIEWHPNSASELGSGCTGRAGDVRSVFVRMALSAASVFTFPKLQPSFTGGQHRDGTVLRRLARERSWHGSAAQQLPTPTTIRAVASARVAGVVSQ